MQLEDYFDFQRQVYATIVYRFLHSKPTSVAVFRGGM